MAHQKVDSVLRRIGLKKGEPRESEARQKLQKQLFSYNKCVEHGFPNKPSALAYDPKLRLLAIGTKTGAIRVYGTPGVEFSGEHDGEELTVTQIFFLPGQGRLISLCSDNSLHLWEITVPEEEGHSTLECVRHLNIENIKQKAVTACCLTAAADQLLVGTEGGNIHVLNIYSFKLTDDIIYQDTVIQNVPDDFKVNPGSVESIKQHPSDPNKFLIGYNRGLIVLWDNKESSALQTYNASQQLESLSWHSDGTQFMSAHADGSYIIWSSSDSTRPKEQGNTPYGPFACKAINKVLWKTAKADHFTIFSGGMPRASCGDRHTVSVMQGNQHTVFDFTSRVVDFVTLDSFEELSEIEKGKYNEPHSLLVLAEEELVAIDLLSDTWQTYRSPYLCSLHSSAITCAQHVSNIPDALWTKITDVGEQQMGNTSGRDWPVIGGKNLASNGNNRDFLLTGHEDGSVRFWDASTTSLRLLYRLTTAQVYGLDVSPDNAQSEEEDWPPFRKVGTFDPYSDDPRLGIQKITLCPLSETLVVGGTAGQVITLGLERESREQEVKNSTVNIVTASDGFVWKGHEALTVREGDIKFAAGFQPQSVMQLQPPAAITALSLHSEWQLIAAGTAHGFGVYDYAQKKEILNRCTLNPAELSGNTAASTPRRKSFKKSLRESFRRLRRRRSERKTKRSEKTEESGKLEEQKPEAKEEGETPAPAAAEGEAAAAPAEGAASKPAEPPVVTESPKPVERQVESRDKTDDGMASMVRCLYFADTFLLNGQNHCPTLWAGTNAGTIYIYQVTIPGSDKRDSEDVTCVLAKEIQLQHRAPIIAVAVIDRNAQPLPAPLEVQHERAKAPDMTGGHHVVVASEEQFKIFSLPSLKANNKFKLTAHEGAKVRKVAFVNFRSRNDERYSENDLACLTNQGEVHVFTIPQLRRQLKTSCVNKDNISGIASSVFTQNGEGFFLSSPSEFTRFSVSVRYATHPNCTISLTEDARPELEAVVEEVPEEPKVEETEQPAEGGEVAVDTAAAGDATVAAAAATGNASTEESAEAPKPDDKPAEAEEKADESAVSPGNDSVLSADDVRVHLSEQSTLLSSSSVSRTVVTRTVVSERTTEGGTVTSEKRTVTETVSGDPEAASAAFGDLQISSGGDSGGGGGGGGGDTGGSSGGAGGNTNLDDDTKLTTQQTTEPAENADALEELHISEEGDEDGKKTVHSEPILAARETDQTAPSTDQPPAVEVIQQPPASATPDIVEPATETKTDLPDPSIEITQEVTVESVPVVAEIADQVKAASVDQQEPSQDTELVPNHPPPPPPTEPETQSQEEFQSAVEKFAETTASEIVSSTVVQTTVIKESSTSDGSTVTSTTTRTVVSSGPEDFPVSEAEQELPASVEADPESTPVESDPTPGSEPAAVEPALVESEPAPVESVPVPMESEPAPLEPKSATAESEPTTLVKPEEQQPSAEPEPEPVPSEAEPVQNEFIQDAPAPVEQTPVTTEAEAGSAPTVVPGSEIPAPSDETPEAVDSEPSAQVEPEKATCEMDAPEPAATGNKSEAPDSTYNESPKVEDTDQSPTDTSAAVTATESTKPQEQIEG